MARPIKCRKVCRLPENLGFNPQNPGKNSDAVILNVDEFETLRLIDQAGLSQEECGNYMGVARTTVQQIYTCARKKLADALVDARPLRIEGGQYELCNSDSCPMHGDCWKKKSNQKRIREGNTVKIAVPLDENKKDVCPVLARAPYFLFYKDHKIRILENPAAEEQGGAGLKAAQFLIDQNADILLTVRCGQNSADVFRAAEMKIYKATQKLAEDNIKEFEAGKLEELTHFHAGFQGIQ